MLFYFILFYFVFVKLQSQVQTSVLGLGVDFILPLSKEEEQALSQRVEQEEQDHHQTKYFRNGQRKNWSLTLKTKSCSANKIWG